MPPSPPSARKDKSLRKDAHRVGGGVVAHEHEEEGNLLALEIHDPQHAIVVNLDEDVVDGLVIIERRGHSAAILGVPKSGFARTRLEDQSRKVEERADVLALGISNST